MCSSDLVLAEAVGAGFQQQREGAGDVGGGERLAVVPRDAGAQLESQAGAVVAPCPGFRQFGTEGFVAVERFVLVLDDKIVEYAHQRDGRGAGRFLGHRRGGRAVAQIHFQDAAALRCLRGRGCQHRDESQENAKKAVDHASGPRGCAGRGGSLRLGGLSTEYRPVGRGVRMG